MLYSTLLLLWNGLPNMYKEIKTETTFKEKIKKRETKGLHMHNL